MNKPARFPSVTGDTGGTARFTAAEFLHMVEAGAFDDIQIELVQGELVRMNPPMNEHAGRQAELIGQLWAVLPDARNRLRGEVAIDLGDDTIVACDVGLLSAPYEGHRSVEAGAILLAVEIAMTTADRDLGVKRLLYASAGVPHYWVVDGKRSVTHVFEHPVDGDYASLRLVPFGETLAVPGTYATIALD